MQQTLILSPPYRLGVQDQGKADFRSCCLLTDKTFSQCAHMSLCGARGACQEKERLQVSFLLLEGQQFYVWDTGPALAIWRSLNDLSTSPLSPQIFQGLGFHSINLATWGTSIQSLTDPEPIINFQVKQVQIFLDYTFIPALKESYRGRVKDYAFTGF